jgi:VCBS repeat-containing protein
VIDASGNYTYTLNNANAKVQYLKEGETIPDIFTYTITDTDGSTSFTTLTITINGANEKPAKDPNKIDENNPAKKPEEKPANPGIEPPQKPKEDNNDDNNELRDKLKDKEHDDDTDNDHKERLEDDQDKHDPWHSDAAKDDPDSDHYDDHPSMEDNDSDDCDIDAVTGQGDSTNSQQRSKEHDDHLINGMDHWHRESPTLNEAGEWQVVAEPSPLLSEHHGLHSDSGLAGTALWTSKQEGPTPLVVSTDPTSTQPINPLTL